MLSFPKDEMSKCRALMRKNVYIREKTAECVLDQRRNLGNLSRTRQMRDVAENAVTAGYCTM